MLYCVHNSFVTVGIFPQPGVDVPESQQYHPEELNRKALAIIDRVRQKLTGLLSAHYTISLVLSIYMSANVSVHLVFIHPFSCHLSI